MSKSSKRQEAVRRIERYLMSHGFTTFPHAWKHQYTKGYLVFDIRANHTWEFGLAHTNQMSDSDWDKLGSNKHHWNRVQRDTSLHAGEIGRYFRQSKEFKESLKNISLPVYLQTLELLRHRPVLQEIGKTSYEA